MGSLYRGRVSGFGQSVISRRVDTTAAMATDAVAMAVARPMAAAGLGGHEMMDPAAGVVGRNSSLPETMPWRWPPGVSRAVSSASSPYRVISWTNATEAMIAMGATPLVAEGVELFGRVNDDGLGSLVQELGE